jgi:hypothetical protein
MVNLGTVIQTMVTKAREILGLVSKLAGGDVDAIQYFDPERPTTRSLDDALEALPPMRMLFVYAGSGMTEFGTTQRMGHRFVVYIKTQGLFDNSAYAGFFTLLKELMDGIPTSGTERFTWTAFDPALEPINVVSIDQEDSENGELWSVSFTLIEFME